MKREPSIHITEQNLKVLLREFFDYDDNADDMIEDLISHLMVESVKLSLNKRSVYLSNQTFAKKVLSKVTNDKTDINLLSNIIYSVRKSFKHKGIKPIDINSSEWSQLKKLVPIVNEFCNEFSLDKRDGYIEYITLGLSKISSYRGYITKLYDMSETISNERVAKEEISNDVNKKLTREIHDYYVSLIIKNTGISETYIDKPLKYNKFVIVSGLVKKLGISYQDFIDSQFDGLAWANSYPEPEQLITDVATSRLNKFLFNKKNNKNTKVKKDKDLVNILKNIKKR